VQRISINDKDLEENYLVDKDGVITLLPKVGGQVFSYIHLSPPMNIHIYLYLYTYIYIHKCMYIFIYIYVYIYIYMYISF
jgi:hypothetical protein